MIFSLVFVLVGAFLLGNALAWRLRSTRVSGTVIGVRPRGRGSGSYCAVYRYSDATGRMVDAACNVFSMSLAGKQTGLTRELLVLANQTQVREADSYFLEIGGVSFLVFGLLYAGSRGSTVVGIDLVLSAIFGWYWFRRSDESRGPKAASTAGPTAQESARLQRAEDILATSEAARAAVRNQRRAGPFIAVMGLAFLAVAGYAGRSVAHLEMAGERAAGTVLQFVQRSAGRNGASLVDHPVVRFTPANGAPVQFEDGVGESPSPYQLGDQVRVLYLPDSPGSSAIIDRGIGNWLLPFGFGLAGVGFIMLGLRQRASAQSTEFDSPSISAPAAPALESAELAMPMNFSPRPEATQDGTAMPAAAVRPPIQLGRRVGWCILFFFTGWLLEFANAFIPVPKSESATGFGPVLLMFAPALGAILLDLGRGLAVVLLVVHLLVRLQGRDQSTVSAAAGGRKPVGALGRVLQVTLTGVLILLASGCILTAIGFAAEISRHVR